MLIFCKSLVVSADHQAAQDGSAILVPSSQDSAAAAITRKDVPKLPGLTRKTTALVINISINKEVIGDFFAEHEEGGDLFFKLEDTVTLKLKFPQDRIVLINGEKYVPLSVFQDVSYTFDEKKLMVSIIGKTTEFKKTVINLYQLGTRPKNLYYPRETSAFLNYGLAYSYTDPIGSKSYSLSNKIGARTGDLFFVSDSLYTKTDTSEQFVRLQSNATYERRNELQWFVVGDQFANSGSLGSTVNIGGIGFSKLYRLDPYFITQPVFNIKGVSEFQSEVEVYFDNVLVSKQSIAPGQFDLANIYSYAGSHKVDIILKDPFGNVRKILYPLYFGTQLLREGLHEYSYNVGFLREQYGTESNQYGKSVFSAFHRYGVTSAFNIGARAEGADGIYNGGLSTSFSLPYIGTFLMSAATSKVSGLWGAAALLQHSYQAKSFSTNLFFQKYSRDYGNISNITSPNMTDYAANLSIGFRLSARDSVSFGYSSNRTFDSITTHVFSGSYSIQLSKMVGLFVNASTTHGNGVIDAINIGFNFTFDNKMHGSTSYNKVGDTNIQALQFQKDTPVGEGLGYHVYSNRTENNSSTSYWFNPGFQYNGRYGIYNVDTIVQSTDHGQTTNAYNLSAAGSLVYAGGFLGASRPVNDSFSIVMVDKLPGVTVLNNGQRIGETNSSGTTVVPNMPPYSQNQIVLDMKNIALDYTISGINQMISPSIWSGSCISFDAVKVRAVTGNVYAKAGDKKVPLEYVELLMKVNNKEVTFPTGKGGEFYLENILTASAAKDTNDNLSCSIIAERRKKGSDYIQPGSYIARGELEGKKCEFSITFPTTEDIITDLGEIQCLIR
jgi:outer membrane usher protein